MVSMSDQMVLLGRAVADENEALIKQLSKVQILIKTEFEFGLMTMFSW